MSASGSTSTSKTAPEIGRDFVARGDGLVDAGARTGGAFEIGGVVDVVQTEAGAETFGPFEVVDERPVKVAAQIDAAFDGAPHGLRVADEEALAADVVVVLIGDAVFENVDRSVVAFVKANERVGEAAFVRGPAEVGGFVAGLV